ncbi:MAG: helix-turn-helix transcriptional regulator [Ruthenibacterium sp.]
MAERLGVSRQTISKWETDETVPDIYQAKKMASLYGIALDELISFDAAVSGLRQAIEKTNGQAEGAVDWTANGERVTPFCFAIRRRWMHKAMPAA